MAVAWIVAWTPSPRLNRHLSRSRAGRPAVFHVQQGLGSVKQAQILSRAGCARRIRRSCRVKSARRAVKWLGTLKPGRAHARSWTREGSTLGRHGHPAEGCTWNMAASATPARLRASRFPYRNGLGILLHDVAAARSSRSFAHPSSGRARGRGSTHEMRLTLAAVGAVVAALLQLTIVPYLSIGDAQPDLVLVFAVVATTAGTVEAGLISAFIGGLMIDLLAPRPLGMTAFMLVVSVGIAAVLGRALDRVRLVVPDRRRIPDEHADERTVPRPLWSPPRADPRRRPGPSPAARRDLQHGHRGGRRSDRRRRSGSERPNGSAIAW